MISPVYPWEDAGMLGVAEMALEYVGFTGAGNGSTTPVSCRTTPARLSAPPYRGIYNTT